ncbi:MAG: FAD-binding protein, partial [Pseudomonadota bacterium]
MNALEIFDVVVVGGGPAGATAAKDLADKGR